MLLAYVSIPRYEGLELDHIIVQEDAKQLYKSGEKRIGTDEKMFIKIFSEKSGAHLAAVNSTYIASYGHSLEKVYIYASKQVVTYFFPSLFCVQTLTCLSHAGNKEGNIWQF